MNVEDVRFSFPGSGTEVLRSIAGEMGRADKSPAPRSIEFDKGSAITVRARTYVCLRGREAILGHFSIATQSNVAEAGEDLRLLLEIVGSQFGLVCETIALSAALESLIHRDDLTGLLNRRGIKQASRVILGQDAPSGLCVIDIDGFKFINDRHGHSTGDTVLKAVSSAITSMVYRSDAVGRYGGDELVVVLRTVSTANIGIVGERIRKCVEQVDLREIGLDQPVTVSVGAVADETGGHDFDELFRMADQALYQAKRGGRNRVVVWTPSAR